MKSYQPSNIVPQSGLVKMTGAALLGGAAVGGITYLVSLFIYVIILFPIGMGTVGGMLSGWAVKSGKVRNPWIASLFGILTGLTIYTTWRSLEHANFLSKTSPATNVNQSIATEKNSELAPKGLGIVRIGGNGGYDIKNMGEAGAWVYWLAELAIIPYVAMLTPRAIANRAFCESANNWYTNKKRFGNVAPTDKNKFLVLVKTPPITEAGTFINAHIKKVAAGSLEIYTKQADPTGEHGIMLSINTTVANKKGQLKLQEVAAGFLSSTAYQQLKSAIPLATEEFTSSEVTYQAHDLNDQQVADIVQQLTHHPAIQATYLLEIASIKAVPVVDTYQLGIIFDRQQISTVQKKQDLLEQLSSEIETPGEAYVTLLNDDPVSLQAIRQIVTQPVYHRKV
jgi:hypothetical protein